MIRYETCYCQAFLITSIDPHEHHMYRNPQLLCALDMIWILGDVYETKEKPQKDVKNGSNFKNSPIWIAEAGVSEGQYV